MLKQLTHKVLDKPNEWSCRIFVSERLIFNFQIKKIPNCVFFPIISYCRSLGKGRSATCMLFCMLHFDFVFQIWNVWSEQFRTVLYQLCQWKAAATVLFSKYSLQLTYNHYFVDWTSNFSMNNSGSSREFFKKMHEEFSFHQPIRL